MYDGERGERERERERDCSGREREREKGNGYEHPSLFAAGLYMPFRDGEVGGGV